MKISVSYLGCKQVEKTIRELDHTDCDYIHVDVMDGKYVSAKENSYSYVKDIGFFTRKRLDIHFMVEKPLKLIDDYAELNVEYMTFHLGIKDDLNEIFDKCSSYGIKCGLAINPDEKVELIKPYLEKIDQILLMSVVPGLPGQEFIIDTIKKIDEAKSLIKNKNILLSIDGGINDKIRKNLNQIDIIVSGSFITKQDNYQEQINKLR